MKEGREGEGVGKTRGRDNNFTTSRGWKRRLLPAGTNGVGGGEPGAIARRVTFNKINSILPLPLLTTLSRFALLSFSFFTPLHSPCHPLYRHKRATIYFAHCLSTVSYFYLLFSFSFSFCAIPLLLNRVNNLAYRRSETNFKTKRVYIYIYTFVSRKVVWKSRAFRS